MSSKILNCESALSTRRRSLEGSSPGTEKIHEHSLTALVGICSWTINTDTKLHYTQITFPTTGIQLQRNKYFRFSDIIADIKLGCIMAVKCLVDTAMQYLQACLPAHPLAGPAAAPAAASRGRGRRRQGAAGGGRHAAAATAEDWGGYRGRGG